MKIFPGKDCEKIQNIPLMEEQWKSYPPIEPANFDLIVIGTGLPECILAASASAAGKTVLHLDPFPFHGTHYASLSVSEFVSFLQSQSCSQPSTAHSDDSPPLISLSLYSSLEISSYSSEPLNSSREFNLDLAGSRALLCSDSMTNLIIKMGIYDQFIQFESVDASLVGDAEGKLGNVPDSRSAIFKDRSLSFTEKNQLMKFFKLVQGHFEDSEEAQIPEEDLESPFVEFMSKIGLSQKLKSIILYAIVLADYDQNNIEACKDVIKTRSGISQLALYHSSIGRIPDLNGAMMYPIYGQGALPEVFYRRAALKGSIQVKQMPVVSVLLNKDDKTYKGVKLASGQELFSPRLILAPSFMIPSQLAPSASPASNSRYVGLRGAEEKVARGICIAKNSIKPEVANCLVVFPPRSLYLEQITSVRVFQLSGNVAVCPSGLFVTYLSAVCDNAIEGKKLLNAAINALFSVPVSGNSENSGTDKLCENTDAKPNLI